MISENHQIMSVFGIILLQLLDNMEVMGASCIFVAKLTNLMGRHELAEC